MPGNGSLSIRVRTLENERPSERCAVHSGSDYVVVTIADSGKGIDIGTQRRTFAPYFSDKARLETDYHRGTGLSAASGIVMAHGGYTQVRSTPGSGTRIKVYLSISSSPKSI